MEFWIAITLVCDMLRVAQMFRNAVGSLDMSSRPMPSLPGRGVQALQFLWAQLVHTVHQGASCVLSQGRLTEI